MLAAENRTITTKIHHSSPPYTLINPTSKKLEGAIPQLVNLIVTLAGYQSKILATPYQRIPIAMNQGTADLGVIYTHNNEVIAGSLTKFSCLTQPLIKTITSIYGLEKSPKAQPTLAIFGLIVTSEKTITLNNKQYLLEEMAYSGRAFKAVVAHRADYVLASEAVARYWQTILERQFLEIDTVGEADVLLCVSTSEADKEGIEKLLRQLEIAISSISLVDRQEIARRWAMPINEILPSR
ncbi:hypothetical protein G8770_04255 [Aestuariicella hydrocarbonica]|uniref:Uncharacterized protein n=2 Tax=Pseudomaricurvus hydrocarbonicus TaxID=1470433 RepID=A0A9E5JYT6_9GAMM|nr:hypothetical protein [Aestuariicella hydrocarbonica]